MIFQSGSICIGSNACNADCFYCVSKQTCKELKNKKPIEKEENFPKFLSILRRQPGLIPLIITGQGEPTLFPEEISKKLNFINNDDFPIVELNTNSIFLDQGFKYYGSIEQVLSSWRRLGLTHICVSSVGVDKLDNQTIFGDKWSQSINTRFLVLKSKGFTTRLNVVMLKDYVQDVNSVIEVIEYAKDSGNIDEITFRPVVVASNTPEEIKNKTSKHLIPIKNKMAIKAYFDSEFPLINKLAYGASVYDVYGMSVCLTSCLDHDPSGQEITRSLIYKSNGHICYTWQHEGSILIR